MFTITIAVGQNFTLYLNFHDHIVTTYPIYYNKPHNWPCTLMCKWIRSANANQWQTGDVYNYLFFSFNKNNTYKSMPFLQRTMCIILLAHSLLIAIFPPEMLHCFQSNCKFVCACTYMGAYLCVCYISLWLKWLAGLRRCQRLLPWK